MNIDPRQRWMLVALIGALIGALTGKLVADVVHLIFDVR